jgi:L-iditol 2-dehydrogenase
VPAGDGLDFHGEVVREGGDRLGGVLELKAVQFRFSIPRYAYTKVAGLIRPGEFYGPRSCVSLRDVPEPELRGPDWLKLRSVLAGFCGSDLGLILLHDSPTTQPFASFPFTIGHEVCAIVEEVGSGVEGVEAGERVTINPTLGCAVREIEPPCGPCSRGYPSVCENFAEGAIAPGMFTGFCKDTGGGWSRYFLAHKSQIVHVPESFTDEQVMMFEPICSSLYPVLRSTPVDGDHVLVIGCGVIGLGVIASIRALEIDCHITAVDPVPLNAQKAREKGADEVIDPCRDSIYERTSRITGSRIYNPLLEKKLCMGGFERIFDCVGSTETINESFRVAAGQANLVIIGIQMPGKVDWAPVWMKGLTVMGDLGHGSAEYRGEYLHSFDIAIDLVKEGKLELSDLITHRFSLDQYVEAIEVNMCKPAHGAIKTIFDLSDIQGSARGEVLE